MAENLNYVAVNIMAHLFHMQQTFKPKKLCQLDNILPKLTSQIVQHLWLFRTMYLLSHITWYF